MKPHRWLLALISRLVPRTLRSEWTAEWTAELDHRETTIGKWRAPTTRDRWRLIREAGGATRDALWLRSTGWHSARFLLRHRQAAGAAVLSLGAGLAVAIAMIGIDHALLFRPPGVTDPARLATLYVNTPATPFEAASYSDYEYYRDHNQTLSSLLASANGIAWDWVDEDHRSYVVRNTVSPNYFDALGVRPLIGTLSFPANEPTVVLAEAYWRRLGADPHVIGKTLSIGGSARVIGVAPASFTGMSLVWQMDAWIPITNDARTTGPDAANRANRWLRPVGRLKPGVTWAEAQADLSRLTDNLDALHPDTDKGVRVVLKPTTVVPYEDRDWTAPILDALVVAAVLTLAAACANVASLLVGLAIVRRHEMAVRVALGASRTQLMAPVIREGLIIGVVAGALGLGTAWGGLAALSRVNIVAGLGPGLPPAFFNFTPGVPVIAAAILLTVVAAVLISVVPAWRAATEGATSALTREARNGAVPRTRARNAFVIVQASIATLVLVGAGASVRSLQNQAHVDLGFSARNLVVVEGALMPGQSDAAVHALYERLRAQAAAVPGVEGVALISGTPLWSGYQRDQLRTSEASGDDWNDVPFALVDDHYFSTIVMRTIAGRTFTSTDVMAGPEVAVINQRLAAELWPGQDPVGRRVRVKNGNRLVEVVGVVADGKYEDLDEAPTPFIYYAFSQHPMTEASFVVRTAGDAHGFMKSVAGALHDENMPEVWVRTFADDLGAALVVPKLMAGSAAGLAALALGLTLIGLYGTVFHAISLRRQELGIRVALGAKPRDLFTLVLRHAGRLALAGSVIGVGAGLLLLPALASVLYGVRRVDAAVVGAVAAVNVTVALLVAYVVVRPWARKGAMEIVRDRA